MPVNRIHQESIHRHLFIFGGFYEKRNEGKPALSLGRLRRPCRYSYLPGICGAFIPHRLYAALAGAAAMDLLYACPCCLGSDMRSYGGQKNAQNAYRLRSARFPGGICDHSCPLSIGQGQDRRLCRIYLYHIYSFRRNVRLSLP